MITKTQFFIGTVSASILIAFTPVKASVIYSYTGNNFDTFWEAGTDAEPYTYDLSMNITGTLELDTPLDASLVNVGVTPISFTFNDGINTLTNLNTNTSAFMFSTDANGDITTWSILTAINFQDPISEGDISKSISTENFGVFNYDIGFTSICTGLTDTGCLTSLRRGSATISTGTWIETTVVPIPATVWLFGSGLLGLIGITRRKRT